MGSKHIPPRWWRQGDEPSYAVYVATEPKFLGEMPPAFEMKTVRREIPLPSREDPGWTCWVEENGAPVLHPETHQEIAVDVDLEIGTEILVPTLWGYSRVKVSSPTIAENAGYYAFLHRGPDVWRSSGGGNKKSINEIVIKGTVEV